jgi:hypothetical protein
MAESAFAASARELISRLPRTFSPSFNDQLAQWELLFPAEQRQFQAQIEWLSRQPPEEFKRLLAPIVEIESRMELPRFDPGKGMSVTDSGILARSPLYPKWRSEVEKVFSAIDEGVGPAGGLKPMPRLLACVLPSGLLVSPSSRNDPLWADLAKQGTWIGLRKPFGESMEPFTAAVAGRKRAKELDDIESTWIFECEARFSKLTQSTGATVLSWMELASARREFLNRLNAVRRDLRSVDETNQDLKRLNLERLTPPAVGERPRIREFVRNLLLSGNGSLVFPDSFVQWGASEALRRAQPQAMLAFFGMRQKLKPFSSSVLFEDQHRGNPAADEDDPAGSLVDGLMLSQYVYYAAQRVTPYRDRTLTLMAAADLDRVLVLGPKPAPAGPLSREDLIAFAARWLESAG